MQVAFSAPVEPVFEAGLPEFREHGFGARFAAAEGADEGAEGNAERNADQRPVFQREQGASRS